MTVFLDMRGQITVDFLEKDTTMNSERDCEILNTVRHGVYLNRRSLTSKGVLFLQDNEAAYCKENSETFIENFGLEVVPHPPYALDLALSDYYLLGPLKNHLRGTNFSDDEVVKEICCKWLKSQPRDFYGKGILKLVRNGKSVYHDTGLC